MFSRTTRILLAVAALLAAAFVLLELPRRRVADRAARQALRLADFDPSRIEEVTIARSADTLSFALRDTHWEMTSPVVDLAEPASVLTLIHAAEVATVHRRLDAPADAARYGLVPPAASIVFAAGAHPVLRLDLGGYTADRRWVYARAGRGEIVLVPTDLLRAATLPSDEYRNRRVVRFDRSVIAAFRVHTRDSRMHWTRAGQNAWSTELDGGTVRGDSIAVESMLRRLRGMRVLRFVDPADTARAFAAPSGVVTLFKSDGASPVRLRFVRRSDGAWWARNDAETRVVEVEGDADGFFAQTVTSLMDRRLLHFAPARARRIEFADPDTSGVLVRAGGVWSHPNPALGPVDPARLSDFVRSMRALQWAAVALPDDPPPSSRGAFSLVVYAGGDTILSELHAWPHPREPGRWTARSRSTGATSCLVEAEHLERLSQLFRRIRGAPWRP
jgi:hypothetical protein